MFTIKEVTVRLLEGIAVTGAIYLISKKKLNMGEMMTLALTLTASLMILDLFSPIIGAGMRHGAGFGLGYGQVAGGSMPKQYYDEHTDPSVESNRTGVESAQIAGDGSMPKQFYESGDKEEKLLEGIDTDKLSPL